jgi:hypothetical protein
MKSTFRKPKFWLSIMAFVLASFCIQPCLNLALIKYSGTGKISMVKHLLALGVTPSDDALGSAAYNGHAAVVRALLTAGANPNAENEIYETPLMYAAKNGHLEVVRLMLAYDANPNAGCREMDPLTVARVGKYTEIVKLLKEAGAKE